MDLRPLSWNELQASANEEYLVNMRAFAQLKDVRAIIEEASPEAIDAAAERFSEDPLAGHDQLTVLKSGIVAWSYEDEDGKPVPVDAAHIQLLDYDTALWAATEIVRIVPTKEDLGNACSPSTKP